MTHIGDHSDQPEIEATFGAPGSDSYAVYFVRRGQTGLVGQTYRAGAGLAGGGWIQYWIDGWDGETPKKRVEPEPAL